MRIDSVNIYKPFKGMPRGTSLWSNGWETSLSNAGRVGLIPDWGTKIPHASQPKKEKENRSNNVTDPIKNYKLVHIKKS